MRKIFVVEYHDQVLELWRAEAISSKQVLHLDFHCDLRGLLINRRTQRAHRIWDRFPGVDEGNFLTHAILEGAISGVRWVHDEPGGRQHDLKTVKYESDLTAFFHRYLIAKRKEQGVPIHYEVIPNSEWTGLNPGELLDIDWDFFASKEYAIESIGQRVEAFFSRNILIPRVRSSDVLSLIWRRFSRLTWWMFPRRQGFPRERPCTKARYCFRCSEWRVKSITVVVLRSENEAFTETNGNVSRHKS